MKRIAVLPILFLLACEGSPVSSPDPQVPTAELKRSAASCELVEGWQRVNPVFDGGSRVGDLIIEFYTTCASDVNVKVYFIYPVATGYNNPVTDGRYKPIGSADALAVVDMYHPGRIGTPRRASVHWVLPKDYGTWTFPDFPDSWNPKFFVEVRSGGTLISSFTVRAGGFSAVDNGSPD